MPSHAMLLGVDDTDVSARSGQSVAHRISEVERPHPLDHAEVLEQEVAADELQVTTVMW